MSAVPTDDQILAKAHELKMLGEEETQVPPAMRTRLIKAIYADESEAAVQEAPPAIATVDIPWRGETFTLPQDADDWPWDALEAMEEGKTTAFVRELLDARQYAAFKKLKPTAKGAGELLDAYMEAIGLKNSGE